MHAASVPHLPYAYGSERNPSATGDYEDRSLSILKPSGRYAHILSLGWRRHGYANGLAIAREFLQAGTGCVALSAVTTGIQLIAAAQNKLRVEVPSACMMQQAAQWTGS